MNEKQFSVWIQESIDGTLSSEGKDQLDKFLQQDPTYKDRVTRMEKVAALLNQVGMIDPPERLKNNILHRIDRSKYGITPEIQNKYPVWLEWLFKPKPKVALAFCSGMIVGGLLLLLLLSGWFSKYPLANLNLVGTIGSSDHPFIEKLYNWPTDMNKNSWEIQVNRLEQLIWMDLNFLSGTNVEIKLKYDPAILNFDQSLVQQSPEISIQTLDKQLIISSKQGGHSMVFFVKIKSAATIIDVTINSGQDKSITHKIVLN